MTSDALRTVRLTLEYDGTDFRGWQRQAEGRTVQAEVETALARLLGTRTAVVASGRTDAGVHAEGLLVSFRTRHEMPADVLGRALDALLPDDVGVRDAREAAPGFHARRDAAWKWYRYRLLRTRGKRPLERRAAWRMAGPLDRDVLDECAAEVVGRRDFASFGSSGSPRASTVRTLHVARWSGDRERLRFDVVGDGFLYRMVRTLVGTMVKASRPGGGGAAAIRRALEARDRRAAGAVAPAAGLSLMAVAVRGEPAPEGVPAELVPDLESTAPRVSSPPRVAVGKGRGDDPGIGGMA